MQAAFNLLFPHQCVSCSTLLEDAGLCPSCWGDVAFLDHRVCDGCGVPLMGDDVRPGDLCDACIARPRPWDQARSAVLYEGQARRIVMRFKHGDRPDIATPLAKWMAQAAQPMVTPDMVVAPVPLHWMRMMSRGFNQAALLSKPLAQSLGLTHLPDLLQRSRATRQLKQAKREERFTEVAGSIGLHPKRANQIKGREVLLVDDVMTSGATLETCTQVCLAAGAQRVCVITLARAPFEP